MRTDSAAPGAISFRIPRMAAWTSWACDEEAVFPVPMAQTGS